MVRLFHFLFKSRPERAVFELSIEAKASSSASNHQSGMVSAFLSSAVSRQLDATWFIDVS
jgi:hypothetical protein